VQAGNEMETTAPEIDVDKERAKAQAKAKAHEDLHREPTCCEVFLAKTKILVGIIAAIVSMVLGIYAYIQWEGATQDFTHIVNNWQSTPIVDISLNSTACPSGWDNSTAAYSGGNILPNWGGIQNICVFREGPNALNRPRWNYTSSAQICPTSYQHCGTQDCGPIAFPCPTSNWMVVPNNVTVSGSGQNGYSQFIRGRIGSNNFLLVTRGSGLPIVNVEIRQGGRPCLGVEDTDNVNVDTVCKDTIVPAGASVTVGSNDENPRFNIIDNATNSLFRKWNVQPITYTTSPVLQWYLSFEQEISWAATCPNSRQDVVNIEPTLTHITLVQLILVIVSVVTGVFTCFTLFCSLSLAGSSSVADRAKGVQRLHQVELFSILSDLVNIGAGLAAAWYAYTVRSFFSNMNGQSCSDAVTNETCNSISSQISDLFLINIIKCGVCLLYLLYRMFSMYSKRHEYKVAVTALNRAKYDGQGGVNHACHCCLCCCTCGCWFPIWIIACICGKPECSD